MSRSSRKPERSPTSSKTSPPPSSDAAKLARLAELTAELRRRDLYEKRPSRAAKADPVRFAEEVFGLHLWAGQAGFLRACRDHARVSVTSGHKTGKTRSLAILAWWFTSDPEARPAARVPMTSSSAEQLKRALWREVTALWRIAKARGYDLPEPALDPATGVRWDDGREIFGFSTKDAERAAGVSGAWIKYLIDEASGVAATIFEAIEGNRAGGSNGSTSTVLASNPTQQSGEFFESHHGKRDLYHPMTLSSEEAAASVPAIPGLATREWIEEKRREWKPDSPIYAVRVLGRFPGQSTDAVIGLTPVLDAVGRWDESEAEGPLVVGLDVARFGDDETVAALRRGRKVLRLLRIAPGDGPDTAKRLLVALADSKLVRDGEVPRVNVDAIGVGASVFDALKREAAVKAIEVNSGSASKRPEEFANLRAELHFAGRAWLAEGGALPDDAKLQAEAVAPKYRTDARGRIIVERKDDIRDRLGRSPDACDAWLLSLYAPPPVRADARPSVAAVRIAEQF